MKCKMPSVSFLFLVHVNLCLHTFKDVTVTSRGVSGGGLLKKIIAAEKCVRTIYGNTCKEVLES